MWVRPFWKDCSRAANQDWCENWKVRLSKKRRRDRFFEISWANENVSTAIAPLSSLPAVLPCWFCSHLTEKYIIFTHTQCSVPLLDASKVHVLTFDCFLYFNISQVTTPNDEWVIRSELVQTRDQDSKRKFVHVQNCNNILFVCSCQVLISAICNIEKSWKSP